MSASAWTPVDETAARWTPVEEAPPQRGSVSGVVRGAKNLAAMPGQMWDAITKPPSTAEEQMIQSSGISTVHGMLPGPVALPVWRLLGKPMEDAENKADRYEKQAQAAKDPEVKKQLLDAAGAYRIGAKVPLVGPVSANLAERAAYGEQGAGQVGPSGKGGWQNENQDVTGAVAEAGTYVVAPKATEDVLKAGAAGIKAIPKVAEVVRDATPKQAAQALGGVSGGIVSAHGNASLSPMGAYYGGKGAGALVESILGKERANNPIIPRRLPVNPGAPLPEAPIPELLQGNALLKGPQPAIDPASSLGNIPVAKTPGAAGSIAESVAAPKTLADLGKPTPPVSKAALGRQIEGAVYDATGAEPPKPLKPNVSLKNQIKADIQAKTPLPKDFTPVESSALKGYKYNPDAQELESITTNGQHYIHGDVSPEQFNSFDSAESKGTAWNDLRKSSPLVAKVVNGQRVAVTPSAASRSMVIDPETGEPELASIVDAKKNAVSAAAKSAPAKAKPPVPAAADEDLTSILQKSVEQATAAKGAAVSTTADPAELSKRWGVDEKSLTEGREQTRGMAPEETEQYIQKLADRYKKGFKPEPVVEVRDADNNLVSVDGRARAIAAQRAGIKRIPVIVRRMKAATGTE